VHWSSFHGDISLILNGLIYPSSLTSALTLTFSFSHLLQIPDKEFEEKLKTEMKDASRATILECDDTECAQVQCVQDNRGNWTCEGGLEGEDRKTTKTVLMMSEDDD